MPTMQTLHVSPVKQKGSDLFPIFSSILLNQLLQLLVFLRRPPVLLRLNGPGRVETSTTLQVLIMRFEFVCRGLRLVEWLLVALEFSEGGRIF